MPSHTEAERKKKKMPLGERIRAAIMERSGADRVVAGIAGENDPADIRRSKQLARKLGDKVPSLSPRRRPENMTSGIFDEGKFRRNQAKKKSKR